MPPERSANDKQLLIRIESKESNPSDAMQKDFDDSKANAVEVQRW